MRFVAEGEYAPSVPSRASLTSRLRMGTAISLDKWAQHFQTQSCRPRRVDGSLGQSTTKALVAQSRRYFGVENHEFLRGTLVIQERDLAVNADLEPARCWIVLDRDHREGW